MRNLLCIDIGNTQIVIALMNDTKVLDTIRIPSTPLLSVPDYIAPIKYLLSELKIESEKIDGSIISSVVPRLTIPFQDVCKILFDSTALIVNHTLPLDLKINYDDPAEVGADRICNAVGALEQYSAPLIVVDMGTATTFDIVSKNREYLGGVIMPGLETAGRDLFKRAAKLPEVSFDFPKKIIGTKTRESLQSGLMWGTIDQIDGLIKRIKNEWNETNVTVIATGGLSQVIAPHSKYIQKVDKSLTLLGMTYIYEQVRGVKS
ncbi:MAG: type III pantothenate kinase [Candidatus Neomarinimicrobiota bacterium]|nr:MAG: type III pantothenate kinase [Candidatus Neomarinimicrobiota bacterium]